MIDWGLFIRILDDSDDLVEQLRAPFRVADAGEIEVSVNWGTVLELLEILSQGERDGG